MGIEHNFIVIQEYTHLCAFHMERWIVGLGIQQNHTSLLTFSVKNFALQATRYVHIT